ncbi:conserved hypothetical protein [Hahella chejuensis KCTC 2396]|uniref:DUF4892 domain-containing protein n=1 Tax=Hahella chejuensis (strain KCTC 2396) TaxID=349521 RepID=Q2SJE7_HAHCH|nr:DUF4892 domain-containing protein [Hahella chejuensis]ABC29227.1 conserved hypothetical protein [Hahella chejuensis KCTC 2396]
MKKKVSLRLLIVLWAAFSQMAAAADGGKVDDLLPRFPLADVVGDRVGNAPEYRLATGPLASLGSVARPEKEERVSGQLTQRSYEIPQGHEPREVMQHYLKELQRLSANILYRCEGRGCGRSNDWANVIFKRSFLYGLDDYQQYLAATFQAEDAVYAVAIYTVRRANQRVFAHVELVELNDAKLAPQERKRDLIAINEAELERLNSLNDKLGPWLNKVRAKPSDFQIFIASYSHSSKRTDIENYEHAADLARRFRVFLTQQAIPSGAIRLIVVGPFADEEDFAESASYIEIHTVKTGV